MKTPHAAKALKEYKERKGLSYTQLSEELENSPQHVHQMISGACKVTKKVAKDIAEVRMAYLEDLAEEFARKRAEIQLHCMITGNPCGTDTWKRGEPCRCLNCQKYIKELETSDA